MNKKFIKELTTLLNVHGIDNDFNTPDFILTEYIINCLKAFDTATRRRMLYEDNFHSNIEITEVETPLPKRAVGTKRCKLFSAQILQANVPDYKSNIYTEEALKQMAEKHPNDLCYNEKTKTLYANMPIDSEEVAQLLQNNSQGPIFCSLKEKK